MNTETFPSPVTKYPEIVIGIVSAIGTDVETAINKIKSEFTAKGYDAHHIKILQAGV